MPPSEEEPTEAGVRAEIRRYVERHPTEPAAATLAYFEQVRSWGWFGGGATAAEIADAVRAAQEPT